MKRLFIGCCFIVVAANAQNAKRAVDPPTTTPFTVVEAGIPEMRAALESGRMAAVTTVKPQFTAREIPASMTVLWMTLGPTTWSTSIAMETSS
jgi:hypothetical protein